ncbi:MAG: HNH endonuclease [Candidatus Rokubacteria bacterium]|nr:HNH endonuclease [Candidatus Rokubacteria bacterium]
MAVTGTIAITDEGWYDFLSERPEVTELNFWTPSAYRSFRAPPFSPFLFKLRAPHNAVCGFAYFAQFSRLPDWLAWETFALGNGCASFAEMHARIARIRARIRYDATTGSDEIGCIQLVSPVFFPRGYWIPQPTDWRPRTQTPVKYDLAVGEGRRVWEACLAQAASSAVAVPSSDLLAVVERGPRYGDPRLVRPRLGQATFRVAVLDAYARGCAVTEEHSLPALEASHIRPFAQEGPHEISNGLLLRSDLHRLFDTGYVTVTPSLRFEVSARLRQDFQNGRTYYPLHGARVRVPPIASHQPAKMLLEWHNEHVFRG